MTAPLRAGELRRVVTVQQRSSTQDAAGGQAVTWSDVKTIYAKIEALTGRELLTAQQVASEVSHRFTVRYDAIFADPKTVAAYRLVYNSRLFDIKASMNVEEEDSVIELLANESLTQG